MNEVAPTFTATELAATFTEEEVQRMVGAYRLGRFVQPTEVAEVMMFLLSSRG